MTDENNKNENSEDQPDQNKPKTEENSEDQTSQDDLNSTMMTIDVSQLDLHKNDTQTDIKVDLGPSDHQIIEKQLAEKQSPLVRFLKGVFAKPSSDTAQKYELSDKLKKVEGVWVCSPALSLTQKVLFYFSRAVLLFLAVFLQSFLIQNTFSVFEQNHPARYIISVIVIGEIILCLSILFLRLSLAWLVNIPLSALVLIMAYGAYFFHTADDVFFKIEGQTIHNGLNLFYIKTFLFMGLFSLISGFRNRFLKILGAVLIAISLIIVGMNNFIFGVAFEQAFWVDGLFGLHGFFNPAFLNLHVLLPLIFVIFAIGSMQKVSDIYEKVNRSLVRSFLLLNFVFLVFGFVLMQKNRVFHIFNVFLPMKIQVGAAEILSGQQVLKIRTKTKIKGAATDAEARYRIRLSRGKEKDTFFLSIQDEFGFPIKNLNQSDFDVWLDALKVKRFKFKEVKTLNKKKLLGQLSNESKNYYDLFEESELNHNQGNYWLSLKVTEKAKPFQINGGKKNYQSSESISFKINQSMNVERFIVKYGDEILLEHKGSVAEEIKLPLLYFTSGVKKLRVEMYDSYEQNIFNEDVSIKIKPEKRLWFVYPNAGDEVANQLDLKLAYSNIKGKQVQQSEILVDGKTFYKKEGILFFQSLDFTSLTNGKHELKVVIHGKDGKYSDSVSILKNAEGQGIEILRPGMGSFAKATTEIVYQSTLDENVVGTKVFVNGLEFNDYKTEKNKIIIPASRWESSEIYVSIQLASAKGKKYSNWIQLNRGLGKLKLDFDKDSLYFLKPKRVAFVLDSSISTSDSWLSSSKWDLLRTVLLSPEVESQMSLSHPSFVVFGSEKPYYYGDCDDSKVLIESHRYTKKLLKRKLDKIKPKGVSALYSALEQVFNLKGDVPEKIYLFTDNTDTCVKNLQSKLSKHLSSNKQTSIYVYALGQLSTKEEKELSGLALKSGGKYFQSKTKELFVKNLLDELELSFEIKQEEKVVYKGGIENRSFELAPGEYDLVLPNQNKSDSVKLNLENDSFVNVKIFGKKGTLNVEISQARLDS